MRKAITVFILLLLAACATPYIEPSGTNTATLTIENANKTTDLGIHAFKVAPNCSGGRLRIGNDYRLPSGQRVSLKVNTNEAFSFFTQYNLPLGAFKEKNCFMPATFTPRQGGNYIARANFSGNKCFLSLVSVTSTGEVKEPTFQLRKFRVSVTDGGASCE